jgi:hypothetical protein
MPGFAGGGPGVDIVALALAQVDAIVRALALATATTEHDFTAIQAALHRHIATCSTATANELEGVNELSGALEKASEQLMHQHEADTDRHHGG